MHDYQDFSKSDKKLLQPLVTVAVQREIANFAKEMLPKHKAIIEKDHDDIRVPFWEILDQFKDFRKHLTRTYDGYSHRNIPKILAAAIVNGDLTMEDFKEFSQSGKQKMEELVNWIQ